MTLNPAAIFSGALGILDLVSSFTATDAVGIFDGETLEQVFSDARPMRAGVRETSMVMRHPIETGVKLSDHHIINQNEINLLLFIKSEFYNSVYVEMRNAWIAATKLSVQTRTGVYNNMVIVNMPHEENPDTFDAITLALSLEEVIFVVPNAVSPAATPPNYSPLDPINSNTVFIGQKYALPISLAGAALTQAALKRF